MVVNHSSLKLEMSALLAARERSVERTRQIAEALGITVSDEFPRRSSAIGAPIPPFRPSVERG
jgi:hypothetical protein